MEDAYHRAAGWHPVSVRGPARLRVAARAGAAAAAGRADASLEIAYCAEIVAVTYQAMGLLPRGRRPDWYDAGQFWSGDDLRLCGEARLSGEVAVQIPDTQLSAAGD
jgi:hypothetical protein